MENWKDVFGYEGFYQVSSFGNVKSMERKVKAPRGLERLIKERILRCSENKGGYLAVVLCKDGIMSTKYIHQIVAQCFLNHNYDDKNLVVNHKNFNRKDNCVSNLEIVTFRENTNKKHLKSSSQYTGVFWIKKNRKWMASIRIRNKNKYLGSFKDEFKAHLAYEKALKELL